MYTQLKQHGDYIKKQLRDNLTTESKDKLLDYHTKRVRDFQHERLIHLLVTFFFALLLLGTFVAWLNIPIPSIYWPLTILLIILFVLELAYIRHYYLLENGVQSLYELTEKIEQSKAD